jgi:hypothetical protein
VKAAGALLLATVACGGATDPAPRASAPVDPVAAVMDVVEHGGTLWWIHAPGACAAYTVLAGRDPDSGRARATSRHVDERDGCAETWELGYRLTIHGPAGFGISSYGEPRLVRAVGPRCDEGGTGWGTIGCHPIYELSAGPRGAVRATTIRSRRPGGLLFVEAEACRAEAARSAVELAAAGC